MAKQIKLADEDILLVVYLLKRLVGNDKQILRLLNKIDTPQELARISGAIQELVDLVQSL